MVSDNKRLALTLFVSSLAVMGPGIGCNPGPRVETAIATNTSLATETGRTPSAILKPTATLPPMPPTVSSTGTILVEDNTSKWCDTFDDGIIDENRWDLPTDPAMIYEENGVLNFRVIEDQSRADEAWAGLEVKLTDKPIADMSFTITLISYGENTPGGTGIDIFLKDAEPVSSVDIGPGPNGPGGEFSFCPDFNAGYVDCEHPTPVPNKAALPVEVGTPIDIHVVGTGKNIVFNIGNQSLAQRPVTASIENFQFFIYADPGTTFYAEIDNVCVTYESN